MACTTEVEDTLSYLSHVDDTYNDSYNDLFGDFTKKGFTKKGKGAGKGIQNTPTFFEDLNGDEDAERVEVTGTHTSTGNKQSNARAGANVIDAVCKSGNGKASASA